MPTQDLVGRKTMKIHTFNGKQQEKEQAAYTMYTTDKGKRIMTKEGVKRRLQKVKPKTKMAKEAVEHMFAATQVPGEREDMTMASEWEESGTEVLQMLDMDIEEQKKHARAPKEQDEQMAMPDSKTSASPEPKKGQNDAEAGKLCGKVLFQDKSLNNNTEKQVTPDEDTHMTKMTQIKVFLLSRIYLTKTL